MKKQKLLPLVIIVLAGALFLSACSSKQEKAQYMDRPAEDGKYHYSNETHGFSVILPAEFEYYQTQSRDYADWNDIEFYVPTNDKEYYQEVPGYGKIMVARMYNKNVWDKVKNDEDFSMYIEVGEKDDIVYTLTFWLQKPNDWKNKFTDELKEEIISSFELD